MGTSLVYLYKDKTSFHNEFIVDSQLLLYTNIVLGLLFVFYMVYFRPRANASRALKDLADRPSGGQGSPDLSRPVRQRLLSPPDLKLHVNDELPAKQEVESAPAPVSDEPTIADETNLVVAPVDPTRNPLRDVSSKTNVFFVYNGHEWECHEVLGISSGASIQQATEVYQKLIRTSDSSTFEFYESAYKAILKKRGESL